MTDFDYDNLQKKITARGAYHKKGGSKSKKCTLPSDYLTNAQKKKLNGPMTEINRNQPMDWETFKGLSDTLKLAYIQYLRETYNANAAMLAQMFGVSGDTVGRMLKQIGMTPNKRGGDGGSKHYKQKMAMWEAFCNGVVGGGDNKSAEEPKKDEPQATCYDIEAEELERAKLAALAESIVEAEEEIAANSEVYSARTEEPETVEPRSWAEAVRKFNEPDPDEALADAIIEAAMATPLPALMRELNTTMVGQTEMVLDNIRDLLALFGSEVEVKIEIKPKE